MLDTIRLAAARRGDVRAAGTDALRIFDGAADGIEDLEIDEFAGHWLVQTRLRNELPAELKTANPAGSVYWKRLGHRDPPMHIAGPALRDPFVCRENGLHYWIDFQAGYSQGLFIDQRDNRLALRQRAEGRTVLNCFAYTCAFGVATAAAGASTTNLDLSKNYLDWGRRNYQLNGLDPARHDFIYGDVMDWLRRLAKKGRRFDMVILDPPTFSRDHRGRVFRLERDLPDLIALAVPLLEGNGIVFVSTNLRKLTAAHFRSLTLSGLPQPIGWQCDLLSMPADFPGTQYLKAAILHS